MISTELTANIATLEASTAKQPGTLKIHLVVMLFVDKINLLLKFHLTYRKTNQSYMKQSFVSCQFVSNNVPSKVYERCANLREIWEQTKTRNVHWDGNYIKQFRPQSPWLQTQARATRPRGT